MNNTLKARQVIAEARDLIGGNGILLDYHVMRHMADIEAIYTYEGTEHIQTLIVGRDITGMSASSRIRKAIQYAGTIDEAVEILRKDNNGLYTNEWLLADINRILILVWDANQHPPAPVQADEYAESGRGLLLVQALSQRWGSYPTPQMGGKVVWALCGTSTGHANPERNRGA